MEQQQFPVPHRASERLGEEVWSLVADMYVYKDERTLHNVAQFERSLLAYSLEPEVVDIDQRREIMTELNTGLAIYHEALPFSEAERRWISEVCDEADARVRSQMVMVRTTKPVIEILRGSAELILSQGHYINVSGEELFQRWSTWCHHPKGSDERIGFETAINGLERVHALLRPDALSPKMPGW